ARAVQWARCPARSRGPSSRAYLTTRPHRASERSTRSIPLRNPASFPERDRPHLDAFTHVRARKARVMEGGVRAAPRARMIAVVELEQQRILALHVGEI